MGGIRGDESDVYNQLLVHSSVSVSVSVSLLNTYPATRSLSLSLSLSLHVSTSHSPHRTWTGTLPRLSTYPDGSASDRFL